MTRYLLGMLFLFPLLVHAQMIKGRIVDLQNQPLKGVAIQWKGGASGTESNGEGRFEIAILPELQQKTLVFNLIGHVPQEITVNDDRFLDVQLTPSSVNLNTFTVRELSEQTTVIERLPEVVGTYIASGKKNEVIHIADLDANLADKTGRQLFAKVPGVFVYDMDGSGNQINIATRGLDPHRSWEYNVRLNGVVTNSDMYGYPASHYSAPMESIEKVELIRGTAALQYGAMFGGMINYVTKTADTTRKISYEGQFNYGSFNTRGMYHALGGKLGKLSYYTYVFDRKSDGYRDNANIHSSAQYMSLRYDFSRSLNVRAELAHSYYRFQMPGPLSDAMFYDNPRQSTRSRNYYSPDIWVPSIQLDWQLGKRTHLNIVSSGIWGGRTVLTFVGFADKPDVINAQTGQYANRNVDDDHFNSFTTEARLKHQFSTGDVEHTLVAGVRYINNDLNREQLGKGTTGSDYDLSLVGPYGRDLWYRTNNLAVFAEHLLQLTPRLSVSGGMRVESGRTDMTGYISYLNPLKVPNKIEHHFPLFGASAQYKLTNFATLYGGISQAYRPIIFADVIPANALEKVDTNLLNNKGYNAELGIRGKWRNRIHFDVSLFELRYNNRMSNTIIQENGQSIVFKTNVGNVLTRGVEFYTEVNLLETKNARISVFTSTSYFDSRYVQGTVVVAGKNTEIAGNRVESTPKWMTRNGLQGRYRGFSASLQYSWVDFSYADPENTVTPTANGAKGIVPAYGLFDFNATYRFNKHLSLKASASNFTDTQYFTKRPTIHPGPGVWPSDGRSFMMTLIVKL